MRMPNFAEGAETEKPPESKSNMAHGSVPSILIVGMFYATCCVIPARGQGSSPSRGNLFYGCVRLRAYTEINQGIPIQGKIASFCIRWTLCVHIPWVNRWSYEKSGHE